MMKCLPFLALAALAHAASPKPLPPAPEGVTIRQNLDYLGPARQEKLDLYSPASRPNSAPSPAVIIIHGGGWTSGDKSGTREFITATTLAKAGYVCASINYELRSPNRWPTNLHDCKNAVRWLRTNAVRLAIDPDRIGVIGGSAGGHLALMVAYTAGDPRLSPSSPYPGVSDRVSACVDMYGIANLSTRRRTQKDGTPIPGDPTTTNLFPESLAGAPDKWRLASPVTHISGKSPPTLILHGIADTTVDRDQSKDLHKALLAAGVDSTLKLIPGANHAWPLKTKSFDLTKDITTFFDHHLKP